MMLGLLVVLLAFLLDLVLSVVFLLAGSLGCFSFSLTRRSA